MQQFWVQTGRVPTEGTLRGLGKEPSTQGHLAGPLLQEKPQEGMGKHQALGINGQLCPPFLGPEVPLGRVRDPSPALQTHNSWCQGETGVSQLKFLITTTCWVPRAMSLSHAGPRDMALPLSVPLTVLWVHVNTPISQTQKSMMEQSRAP